MTRTGVIVADTSAWVEFDRAYGSAVDARLTAVRAKPAAASP